MKKVIIAVALMLAPVVGIAASVDAAPADSHCPTCDIYDGTDLYGYDGLYGDGMNGGDAASGSTVFAPPPVDMTPYYDF